MREFKGTKTEWQLAEGDKTFVYALNEKGTNAFSLSINNDGKTSLKEQQANALLISKAPQILSQLIKLYNSIDSCIDLTPELLKETQQLIKEATEPT